MIYSKGRRLKGYENDKFEQQLFYFLPHKFKLLDSHQRLSFEVAYETFEDVSITLPEMNGSRTGVFVGISATDYSHLQFPDINTIDAHTQTGISTSIVANRLSYFYNLLGPSFIVDTACSSALVALNCACQSIRSGESSSTFCDGLYKAFDASANGYVRSEGAGILLLKPLSNA
ncbi:MAG: putative type I polyketide synthase, partial [Streblomastix strix]